MAKTKRLSVLESGRVLYLPAARIRPNPLQPRKHFDAGALQELAESIRQYGVLQPLTVRRLAGGYELVAGERRLRAARLAGLSEVPCLLADVDEESSGMLALVENLQRRDLDYIEEAEGLQKLMQQYHLSQEQAARRIGKSQSAVANKLRILRHPPSVLQALREHQLTERHARALLKLPDEAERLRVIALIVQNEWTVAKQSNTSTRCSRRSRRCGGSLAGSSCAMCACCSTPSTISSTCAAPPASPQTASGARPTARSS